MPKISELAAQSATVTLLPAVQQGSLTVKLTPAQTQAVVGMFATRSAAASALIHSSIQCLQTAGYATLGDGGAALYIRASGTTFGGFQSADGAWWALEEDTPHVAMFGAFGDDVGDYSAQIQAAHDYLFARGGGELLFGAGIYRIGSQLTFDWTVSLRGAGRGVTQIKATAAIAMFVWAGTADVSEPSLRDIKFDGNSLATAGIVIGTEQNILLEQVQIDDCVNDGLVLAGTQNSMFLDVFVQGCGLSNFRNAGGWNNTFVRCGGNAPGNSGYHYLSRLSAAYFNLVGTANPGPFYVNARHQAFFHCIMERGSPINIIRLEDDDGDNSFYDMELVDGSVGNPQVYIGASSLSNLFFNGNLNTNGTACSYAFANNGFGTHIKKVAGLGWAGIPWILNTSPGTVNVEPLFGGGTITDVSARSFEEHDVFATGAYGHAIAEGFTFFLIKNDGIVNCPLLEVSTGKIVPETTRVQHLGAEARLWGRVWSEITYIGPLTFSQLPANAAGYIAQITDSTANTWGTAIGGGGGNRVLAWNNGLGWTVIGI